MPHPFPPARTLEHLAFAEARGIAAAGRAAARRHGVPEAVFLAVGSRESGLGSTLSAAGTGDGGHGRGVWQLDDRSHGPFVRSHRNDDHAAHADYAARFLARLYARFSAASGRPDWPRALAAYNAGEGRVARLPAGAHPDTVTTGRDYSVDVLARARTIAGAGGGASAASGPRVSWGTVGLAAGAVAVLVDPTFGALTGLGLGVLAKAQQDGHIA